jgi:glycerol uptake facilitator-like aquaporin
MAYEFLGTAALVYAVNISNNFPFAVIGIVGTLWISILFMGPVTGGHCNPAVTLGVLVSNKHAHKDLNMFFSILIAEFAGGIFGILLAFFSLRNPDATGVLTELGVPSAAVALLIPKKPLVSGWGGFQIEVICTFIFVLVILIMKTQKTAPTSDGFLACGSICLTLGAMCLVAGPHTGGGINPAVGLAQTLWAVWNFGTVNPVFYQNLWLYICAPSFGGILAGFVMRGHV